MSSAKRIFSRVCLEFKVYTVNIPEHQYCEQNTHTHTPSYIMYIRIYIYYMCVYTCMTYIYVQRERWESWFWSQEPPLLFEWLDFKKREENNPTKHQVIKLIKIEPMTCSSRHFLSPLLPPATLNRTTQKGALPRGGWSPAFNSIVQTCNLKSTQTHTLRYYIYMHIYIYCWYVYTYMTYIYIHRKRSPYPLMKCDCTAGKTRCVCIYMYIYIYIYIHILIYSHVLTYIIVHIGCLLQCNPCTHVHIYTDYSTCGDVFECCFKAQSSKLERLICHVSVKRDVWALSFELWKSFRKCHRRWDGLYV